MNKQNNMTLVDRLLNGMLIDSAGFGMGMIVGHAHGSGLVLQDDLVPTLAVLGVMPLVMSGVGYTMPGGIYSEYYDRETGKKRTDLSKDEIKSFATVPRKEAIFHGVTTSICEAIGYGIGYIAAKYQIGSSFTNF
ncbi:hypothetical protein HYT24_01075 [Candidatus Pacearchaeota archaeon]|nr:hypothetical protein [Candidatus Pacearchaeota archaeon]